MSESSRTEVNMVTIPLEEYIELRQAKQNNMYLCDRFQFIDDRIDNAWEEVNRLTTRVYDLEKEIKKLKDA